MSNNHGMGKLEGIEAYCETGHERQPGDRFGRLFSLPSLYTPGDQLSKLGAKGGVMDAKKRAATRTKTVPVGHIFFGQFLDHDITLDVSTSLSSVTRSAASIANARTPTLDLDCVYAQGPEASPYLYHSDGQFSGVKLLLGADGTAASTQMPQHAKEDLCRSSQGTAIIGDPRNDENRIISQMQLGMLRFHNKVVDHYSAHYEGKELYEVSREAVTWHYQWAVIHDYLPAICGGSVVADILGNGRRFYCAQHNDPFIPVEFSVAAYRFGHSMIPQEIQIQKGKTSQALFGKVLGKGFSPLDSPGGIVDWRELFLMDAKCKVQMAEKLDSKMATILLELPFVKPPGEASLATRNLLRGQGFLLPSGENVALALGRSEEEIALVQKAVHTLTGNKIDLGNGTPLWLYLLLEAEKIGRETTTGKFDKGEGLGPVGARIVAETVLGLIELDGRSYLSQNRSWTPADGVGISTVGGMLTY